ncbi:MAG: GTP cyclohydrolase I FolE2 [Thermoplasmata archaeon]|nr:GTP cyclohydrolase I FolE2 [Thermoplasmata archaeon]
MGEYPDVQGIEVSEGFKISRVGVKGIKREVKIARPDRVVHLVPTFDISVDLPADQKGSHMSRHVEVINRAIDMVIEMENQSLEGLVERIAVELLKSHEYATYADVELKADYFMEKASPDERRSVENYIIFASAKIQRGDERPMRSIGVEVSGMSTCPCAMETVRSMLKDDLRSKGYSGSEVDILDQIPVPTHNQRNIALLKLECRDGINIEAEELIDIIESCLSSPTYEILKRKGEGIIVLDAHMKPKFVEDIIRDIIATFLERYPDIPPTMTILVRSTSEESIHKHNAFAERIGTLGELRNGSRFDKA